MAFCPKNILSLKDEENNTLLMIAAQAGHKEIVELFLDLGCNKNAQNVNYIFI